MGQVGDQIVAQREDREVDEAEDFQRYGAERVARQVELDVRGHGSEAFFVSSIEVDFRRSDDTRERRQRILMEEVQVQAAERIRTDLARSVVVLPEIKYLLVVVQRPGDEVGCLLLRGHLREASDTGTAASPRLIRSSRVLMSLLD